MDLSAQGIGGGMWFTLSLINAGLAESKGRSRLAWWFLSLFIGPFATFLIVVMPRGDIVDPGSYEHAVAEAAQRPSA